ncbi:unnamed protein product [Mytilus coruscus]|uniref:MULE transposase domain-containing protein n=1 Tax=Mytilus coruscus TaxID=42192 RepID=A0A6J8CPF9_MYTCO|nr:unnamed protein product [Mytilus coruscus]
MDLVHTETNRGKTCIIYDGFSYRSSNILKNGDTVKIRFDIFLFVFSFCRFSSQKECTASITTDPEGIAVVKTKNAHNHERDEHKAETRQLRVIVRQNAGDISKTPSQVIRGELQKMEENLLNHQDLKNVAMSLYRERRKQFPKLPKSRFEIHETLRQIHLNTNKTESFTLVNDFDSGIVIFSCFTNLECLCNEMTDIFIDGTFKSCPKFFYQLYSIHGCKNSNCIPLVFALLPLKSEECYIKMWDLLIDVCTTRRLTLQPEVFHIDFECAMHTAVTKTFSAASISCCRFHLGQSWWRKIQLGLSADYKDRDSDFGKWLTHFFGLAYLPTDKIEECFIELIADAPSDDKCMKFADYILEFYTDGNSRFPPTIWASPPDPEEKRTTNGAESFHAHLNEQFYASHPNIFVFVDVLLKLQTTSYIKMRTLTVKAPVRKYEKEKMNFLLEQNTKLVNGECTTVDFVRRVGYKYSARTDL